MLLAAVSEPWKRSREMHQHQINVLQSEFFQIRRYSLECCVVTKLRRKDLGGDENFVPWYAAVHGVLNSPTNGAVIEIQVCAVNVTTAHQQIPQHRASHEDIVVSGWSTTHAESVLGHFVATRQIQKEFVGRSRFDRLRVWNRRGSLHFSVTHNRRRHVAFHEGDDGGKEGSERQFVLGEPAENHRQQDE